MITLRKDKSDRLSIKELDDNFEYLAMQSNDIDLYWRGSNSVDTISDTLYIKDGESYYVRTFVSLVDRLGIKIKNYDLIKNDNPEIIIERYKKPKNKHNYGNIPARHKITYPYSDTIYSHEIQDTIGNGYIFRPMIIPVTAESAYYRIYAENYFSPINPPKVLGSKNNFYVKSNTYVTIPDDTSQHTKDIPNSQKGTAYCRLSIRISDGMGGYIYSKPLKEFKIIMHMVPVYGRITYDLV